MRLRITAEPARRDHSACADAQQNDGQHRREDAIRSVDEELQEAKPDHLQRQQRRTRQKRRPEQTPGAGAERRVSGGCLGKRRRRVFFQTAGQRRGYQGHRQIDRPGSQCRRPQPQPFNQPQLSAERAGQCPERVPAIQTAKHAPEVGVPAREDLGEQWQRQAHGGRRQQHNGESHGQTQEIHHPGPREQVGEEPAERGAQAGQAEDNRHPQDADDPLGDRVEHQGAPQQPLLPSGNPIADGQPRHEARQDDVGCPHAVAKGEARDTKPQRFEQQPGRSGEEEHHADERRQKHLVCPFSFSGWLLDK